MSDDEIHGYTASVGRERPPVVDFATDFDHFDPGFVADPYPIYADLHERCPVAHSDRFGGMTVLTTFDHVGEAAHDTDRFTSRRIIISETSTRVRGAILPPINLDPPDHTEPRRVMLPFFSPRSIHRWEQPVRDICNRLIDDMAPDRADLAVDYARHIPGEVTAAMFGLPVSEADFFREWVHEILEVGPIDPDVERRATRTMVDYMTALLAERRAEPNPGDLPTLLLDSTIDDEPITDADMAKMLMLLLLAGIDTTWSGIGSSMLHLATHADDLARLVAEPELIPSAVEEFLRAYSPVQVGRIATRDTEVGGCPVSAGDWVFLGFPGANRDPAVFDAPHEVRIDRQQNRHAAFGLGVHRCLGSNLARLEMTIAIECLLARRPDFALVEGADVAWSAGTVRGPRSVPVRFGP